MSEIHPTFLKWGNYPSKDKDNPNVLEIVPQELETFETEYSINARVTVDGEEQIIPLQSLESNNKQLHQLWYHGVEDKKIKIGKKFNLKTWLGISKNARPIRRFELEF